MTDEERDARKDRLLQICRTRLRLAELFVSGGFGPKAEEVALGLLDSFCIEAAKFRLQRGYSPSYDTQDREYNELKHFEEMHGD